MHAFIEFHWHELVTINYIEGELTELNTNVKTELRKSFNRHQAIKYKKESKKKTNKFKDKHINN